MMEIMDFKSRDFFFFQSVYQYFVLDYNSSGMT